MSNRMKLICTLAVASAAVACRPPTAVPTQTIHIVDASAIALTRSDVARPADPAGLLSGRWPDVSEARMTAISMAVFHLNADEQQVTVKNLGSEGRALALGEQITARARSLSKALDSAALVIAFTKSHMASIARDANPTDQSKVIEAAANMDSDLNRLGHEARHT